MTQHEDILPMDGFHRDFFAGGALAAEGACQEGKRHGHWTYYHKNGRLKAAGEYVEGEFNGYWEWWRENGQPLQAGAFDRGRQTGPWKRYYHDGQLWDEGIYDEHGRKIGLWTVYDRTGAVKQSKHYNPKSQPKSQ